MSKNMSVSFSESGEGRSLDYQQEKTSSGPVKSDESSFASVVDDLFWLQRECERRCMVESVQWANEQLSNLPDGHLQAYLESRKGQKPKESNCHDLLEEDVFDMNALSKQLKVQFARSLIISKEYRRAKIHIRNRLESEADDPDRRDEHVLDPALSELRHELEAFFAQREDDKRRSEELDCFLYYLLGLVRKDASVSEDLIRDALRKAVEMDVRCWPAFEALAFVSDPYYVALLEQQMGSSWSYRLYYAETLFRHQHFFDAVGAFTAVSARALGSSPYLLCQIAASHSEGQQHDLAVQAFAQVHRLDPYRIDQMHLYSDSLYIRKTTSQPELLANLAKWFYESHKYNWVTCCICANYYSARKGHDMAQEFLKRAIRLCPGNASIWVLLGHELMETHNHQAAISAYRKAIVIEPRCYRGWYSLGQLYEILKQPSPALYHYQQAHRCRPVDSRILIALGVVSLKLGRKADAEKLFKKAFQVGDVEGNALTHLAKAYEDRGDSADAAKAYEAYLTIYTEEMIGDLDSIATARSYLARHYLEEEELDKADDHAQRCLDFEQSKEEGMRILRLVTNRRNRIFIAHRGNTQIQTQKSSVDSSSTILRTPGASNSEGTLSLSAGLMKTPAGSGGRRAQAGAQSELDADYGEEEDMILSDGDDDPEISF